MCNHSLSLCVCVISYFKGFFIVLFRRWQLGCDFSDDRILCWELTSFMVCVLYKFYIFPFLLHSESHLLTVVVVSRYPQDVYEIRLEMIYFHLFCFLPPCENNFPQDNFLTSSGEVKLSDLSWLDKWIHIMIILVVFYCMVKMEFSWAKEKFVQRIPFYFYQVKEGGGLACCCCCCMMVYFPFHLVKKLGMIWEVCNDLCGFWFSTTKKGYLSLIVVMCPDISSHTAGFLLLSDLLNIYLNALFIFIVRWPLHKQTVVIASE